MARASRGKGEGSVYRRADGSWTAQVEAGRSPQGKRRYARATRATKAEALEALRELVAQRERGVLVDRRMTVGEWLDWWLHNASTDWSPATVKAYGYAIRRLKAHLGSVRLAKLSATHVREMLRHLADENTAPHTRRLARGVLVTALRDAERAGLVDRNAAQLVRGPKLGAKLDDALNLEEARTVLKAAAGDRLETLWVLALRFGLREGELVGLEWKDVDLVAETLTVVRSKTRSGERTVPLVAGTTKALVAHRQRQEDERLAAGDLWHESGRVFTRPDGSPLTNAAVQYWWRELLGRTDVPYRRFHATRHSAAQLLLDSGVPLEIVSAVLGHASLSITMDVYGKASTDAKRRALGKLDDLWE